MRPAPADRRRPKRLEQGQVDIPEAKPGFDERTGSARQIALISCCCACGGRPGQAGCGVLPGGIAPTVYETPRSSPACSTLVSMRQERCRIRTSASLYRGGRRNLPGFCYRLKNRIRRLTLSFVALTRCLVALTPSASNCGISSRDFFSIRPWRPESQDSESDVLFARIAPSAFQSSNRERRARFVCVSFGRHKRVICVVVGNSLRGERSVRPSSRTRQFRYKQMTRRFS